MYRGGEGAAWDYGIGSAVKSSDSSFIQVGYRTLCANWGLGAVAVGSGSSATPRVILNGTPRYG